MILRADHVAGAAFVVFGVAVIALSGDLPVGQLSMPGSGFLPMIVAALTIIFGLILIVRAKESGPFSELGWGDGKHAAMVTVITAVAIALYERDPQLSFQFSNILDPNCNAVAFYSVEPAHAPDAKLLALDFRAHLLAQFANRVSVFEDQHCRHAL